MRKTSSKLVLILVFALLLTGCGRSFWGGGYDEELIKETLNRYALANRYMDVVFFDTIIADQVVLEQPHNSDPEPISRAEFKQAFVDFYDRPFLIKTYSYSIRLMDYIVYWNNSNNATVKTRITRSAQYEFGRSTESSIVTFQMERMGAWPGKWIITRVSALF